MGGRPVIIDEADGACEICAGWAGRRHEADPTGRSACCDECHALIPAGLAVMGVTAHHFHLRGIGPAGAPGRAGVHQTLCKECAIALRLAAYPPGEKDRHGNPWPTAEAMRDYRG